MEEDICESIRNKDLELIVGNSNPNFSGITSTMLQMLPFQQKVMKVKVMGKHHLNNPSDYISFWQVAKICRQPLKNGKSRIFHARRVDEMIQALVLKHFFGAKFKIVFSSAAQRYRSKSTLWLTRKMDAVISMCKASSVYLENPPDAIIYHGVNIQRYAPVENKVQAWQSLGLIDNQIASLPLDNQSSLPTPYGIAILGRVRAQKGVHHFVEACIDVLQQHPDYTAVVVGAIAKKHEYFAEQLKAKIAAAGMSHRIIFTGEQKFSDLPKIFSSLSLVAALSDNEGFGLTVLEAMSSGAAVLATEAGAWPEIIRENIDGNVVPVNDFEAIKSKLEQLITDPERLAKMGQSGRERILSAYTVEREAKELCKLLKNIQ
jgi:mannosyltransferase